MEEAPVPVTDEDLRAARDAIRRNPAIAKAFGPEAPDLELAKWHHRWGSDQFQVNLGLREPANEMERCTRELLRGEITLEEARARMRAHAQRPVDAPMLQGFFADLEKKLHRYGQFMQEAVDLLLNPHRQPVGEADEVVVDRLAEAIFAKVPLDKEEIESVFLFLQEARIERGMGNVRLKEFSAPTAAELVIAVTHDAQQSWQNNRTVARKSQTDRQYLDAVTGTWLFGKKTYESLPRAQDIQTLVDEEYALARVYLRQRQAAQPASDGSSGGLAATDVSSGGLAATDAGTDPVLLTVERWSELAIGIDEQWRYWALTPVPAPGQRFMKSRAVELPLVGERWKAVLTVLADSEGGDAARRADLVVRLGYLPPNSSVRGDGRARPGSVEAAQVEALQVRQKAALKRLNGTMGDLRRELGRLVKGPQERSLICLRTDDDVVSSGFVVRCLVRDESDCLLFGQRP